MALFQRYNNENILIRAIIAGLLDVLNNNIKYNQVWGNDTQEDIEQISVPWFFNQAGDERFMQDFYTHYAGCMPPRPVDGNFDMIPRGTLSYTGSAISAERITSRYVQGRYVKEIDGKLEGFVSYLYSIPLTVNFDCNLWVDTYTTALKIEQEIREVFYKNVTFYVYYKGLRIGSRVGFPEQTTVNKNFQYSFESENKIKMDFSLEVESYQPVFDPTTEMPAKNKVTKLTYRLWDRDEKSDGKISKVEISSPSSGSLIPKGIPIWIKWNFSDEGGIMRNVDLYWAYSGENENHPIALVEPNYEYYIWSIPKDFTEFKEPQITWIEDSGITVSRKPEIKVIPDLNTGQITPSSFQVFSEGYFLTSDSSTTIQIELEMKDSNGNIEHTEPGKIWANILYNKLDLNHPISMAPDASIYFSGNLDSKKIDIYVANSVNNDVWGVVENITII